MTTSFTPTEVLPWRIQRRMNSSVAIGQQNLSRICRAQLPLAAFSFENPPVLIVDRCNLLDSNPLIGMNKSDKECILMFPRSYNNEVFHSAVDEALVLMGSRQLREVFCCIA